jgi:hypothetical protein
MPTAATTAGGTVQTRGNGQRQAVVPTVPFIRASAEHREPTGIDTARLMTAADQDLGVFDIPAYGYVRSIILLVQATGGAGTSVTAAEDGPWNVLKNIALTEPNGAVINQFNSGYDLYQANKMGGYRSPEGADPKASPRYSAVAGATGNFTYILRIPVELNLRDGLGSLPNQNAAATFKLRLTMAGSTQVYGTVPTTLPSVRVRAYLEAWDQPEVNTNGATNQTTPPAMNTTQFWSSQTYNVNVGQNTIRLTRVGNYLRNMILILRRAGTSRVNGELDWADPTTLYLDTRPLDIIENNNWLHQMYERTGFGGAAVANEAAKGLDNGVRVYDFMHEFDGVLGRENRDLWLPTLGSTRLELQGSFLTAGRLRFSRMTLLSPVAYSSKEFLMEEYNVRGGGVNTEYATAAVVIGALVFLILVRRGFRGVSAAGVSVGIR